MGKLQKNQKGFTAVEGLLIILILVVIGAVGYLVYHNHHKTTTAAITTTSATKPATTIKTTTPATVQPVNPYAGWSTYTATDEGLSFKYPSTWKAYNDPCVNPDTQATGQCWQILSPSTSASPYIFEITYYWNQQAASALNGGQTIKTVTPLSVPNTKTPLSLVSYTTNQISSSNIVGLTLTDQNYTVGQTVSYIPNVTSQKQSGMTYTFAATMKTPSQQDIANYTLAQYLAQPDYSNVVKIFQSISY